MLWNVVIFTGLGALFYAYISLNMPLKKTWHETVIELHFINLSSIFSEQSISQGLMKRKNLVRASLKKKTRIQICESVRQRTSPTLEFTISQRRFTATHFRAHI